MTQEEKARAYDDAIKKAESLYKASEPMSGCNVILETLFPELKESEDERIRGAIIDHLKDNNLTEWAAWLEKQGEKDILEDAILDGYILDGNEDGLIAETIKYKNEKQAEQNQTDKVKPKFKVGDWIINPRTGLIEHIKNVLLCSNSGNYEFESSSMSIDSVDNSFHLWTIQDAKDSDVLYINNTLSESIMIYKSFNNGIIKKYASYNKFGFEGEHYLTLNDGYITPATKEQRDTLMKAMVDAGYTFDFENKKLKKIEPKPEENKGNIGRISPNWSEEDEEYNGEDYGIDSLYHAQRILEKTLGSVEGYQSDDGILEHKCAISAVKKLYEQNPAWSEEDKGIIEEVVSYLINYSNIVESKEDADRIEYLIDKIQDICPLKEK